MTSYIIPSYQRPLIFKDQTYAFLKKHKIDDKDIHLFLRSDDPYLNDYMDRATDINIHITDVKGIGRTHNFITETFDEDTFLVEIDDDLIDLYGYNIVSYDVVKLKEGEYYNWDLSCVGGRNYKVYTWS